MAKPNSTVVVLGGEVTEALVADLDRLPNVRAARFEAEESDVRAFTSAAHTPYVVHDRDPLRDVAEAWVGFFEETAPIGTLEVTVRAARRMLSAGSTVLPDYYLIVDPDGLGATERHWWFGALADVAPSRVVPAPATAAGIAHVLAHLPSGRWWPEPADDWLLALSRFVPDRGLSARHRAEPGL